MYKSYSKAKWLDTCDGRSSEIVAKENKIGSRVTNGRGKAVVQELNVIYTEG